MGLLDHIHEHHARQVAEVAGDHYRVAMAQWQEADANSLARYNGQVPALVGQLEAQLQQHQASRPKAPETGA